MTPPRSSDERQTSRLRRRRIAVLELLVGVDCNSYLASPYVTLFRRQFCGVMSQVVAAWCRRRGHDVSYATYYGQVPAHTLVSDEVDLVFISAFTEAAALAYSLAELFRRRGIRTVLGGPHAKSFASDSLRFFDVVVKDCDESSVADIADGHLDAGIVDVPNISLHLPPLAERRADLDRATLLAGRFGQMSVVPVLSSIGCPYDCNFCIDATNPYRIRPLSDLAADLRYAAASLPGRTLVFHDPNFGVSFEKTLSTIEEAGASGYSIKYMAESSLSILKGSRLSRLRNSGCIYVAPAVESWFDFGRKSGDGQSDGPKKFARIVDHFESISAVFPGVQANFLFGVDADQGVEPAELTRAFIRRFPNIFPGLAYPIAFGGVPLRQTLRCEGRLLPLPPFYYFDPVPTLLPKNYSIIELLEQIMSIFYEAANPEILLRRAWARGSHVFRLMHVVRTLKLASYARELRRFRNAVLQDVDVRAFCEGRSAVIPAHYDCLLDCRLGRYADVLPRTARHELVPD